MGSDQLEVATKKAAKSKVLERELPHVGRAPLFQALVQVHAAIVPLKDRVARSSVPSDSKTSPVDV